MSLIILIHKIHTNSSDSGYYLDVFERTKGALIIKKNRFLFFLCLIAIPGWTQNSSQVSMAPIHWIELDGAYNMRDIGGYGTTDGKRVSYGVLYRSDRFQMATERDCRILRELGIRSLIDLRSPEEVYVAPDAECLRSFLRFSHYPIYITGSTYQEAYYNIVTTYSSSLVNALKTIADPENLPLVYHCTQGKDRTGVLTALILELLGAGRETILFDYLRSNQAGYYVDESWLQMVFDRIDEEGGIEAFLLHRDVGVDIQSAIRANLLQIPSSALDWELYVED